MVTRTIICHKQQLHCGDMNTLSDVEVQKGELSSQITFYFAKINVLRLIGRQYLMVGKIQMENGNMFILKSFMRKCHSKRKCHSTGILQTQHQKDTRCLNQEKTANTITYANTSSATGLAWGQTYKDTFPSVHQFAFIHIKMHQGHECYNN